MSELEALDAAVLLLAVFPVLMVSGVFCAGVTADGVAALFPPGSAMPSGLFAAPLSAGTAFLLFFFVDEVSVLAFLSGLAIWSLPIVLSPVAVAPVVPADFLLFDFFVVEAEVSPLA